VRKEAVGLDVVGIGIAEVDMVACMVGSIVEVARCQTEAFAGVDRVACSLEAEVGHIVSDLVAAWEIQMVHDTADPQYPLMHPGASRVSLGIPARHLEGVIELDVGADR
jgi:hypothetical protein